MIQRFFEKIAYGRLYAMSWQELVAVPLLSVGVLLLSASVYLSVHYIWDTIKIGANALWHMLQDTQR
jgi:hypothetical protein